MLLINRYWILGVIFLLFPILSMASEKNEHHFLVISDIHLDTQLKRPMNFTPSRQSLGFIGINDLDLPTFKALLNQIRLNIKQGLLQKPEFILILGDIGGHRQLNVAETEGIVFRLLAENFPDTPLFYIFGNNDSFSGRYGPFMAIKDYKFNSPYEAATQIGMWKDGFLSTGQRCGKKSMYPCIIEENRVHGYYSARLQPNLRMIGLNSVPLSPQRQRILPEDARHELKWLGAQLRRANETNESVLIATHIPPGYNIYDHSILWAPESLHYFLQLVNQYHSIMMGILVGHTHQEELKIITNARKENIAGIYYTAGLSTSHGNAPSIKTFDFRRIGKKWALTNYTAFRFSNSNGEIHLTPLYNYNDYYCDNASQDMLSCLKHVTIDKIKKYLSVENPNFSGVIRSPQDMILTSPN